MADREEGGSGNTGAGRFGSPRILVAEDNRLNQRIVRLLLDQLGLTATIVDDGAAACEELKRTAYDLAFLDIHMPKMDGRDLARWARRDLGDACPYLVAMSASLEGDRWAVCQEAGFHDCVGKPTRKGNVVNVLERFAARRGRRG